MSLVLETILAGRYEPGTNLSRQFAGAGWLHLLPNLELTGVILFGTPGRRALTTLTRRARRVAVACVARQDFRERDRARGTPGLERVEWLDGREPGALADAAGWADLAVLVGRASRRWLAKGGEPVKALQCVLDRGGLAYTEHGVLGGPAPGRKGSWGKLQRLGKVRSFHLLPLWGEAQVAVPEGDGESLRYLLQSGTVHPWSPHGLRGLVAKFPRLIPSRWAFGRRYGTLVGGSTSPHAVRPPEYLCAVARESGISLEGYRWALSIPVAYRSRKLIFYLFGPHPFSQNYAVKMVSEPLLNRRLENEGQVLRQLEALGVADGERIPRVAFSGTHAGLALLGQGFLEGVPFLRKSEGDLACPYAGAAVDGIVELGQLTRQRGSATGPEVASAVSSLLGLFAEIYGDRDVVAFLEPRIAALGRDTHTTPLVFQHGDPGIWNLVVTPGGRTGFLDWESAEPAGLPLWDLFYFLRSYAVWSARRRGLRDQLKACESAFLTESDMARWVRGAVARYCDAVGVAEPFVEPLFYTCWMHRSIKEATRLEPHALNKGHYVNLLRLLVRGRGRDSLNRLFSLSG